MAAKAPESEEEEICQEESKDDDELDHDKICQEESEEEDDDGPDTYSDDQQENAVLSEYEQLRAERIK
jgi:hypothetical protein